MAINLMYVIIILVAIYFGIVVYVKTRQNLVIWVLLILVVSLILEIQRMNLGSYSIDTTDAFRTLRDIARTIITIVWLKIYLENYKKKGKSKK